MSLVSTYVLANDGMFYQDPTLGNDDWFLCFDDDEPPELVISDPEELILLEENQHDDARLSKIAIIMQEAKKAGLDFVIKRQRSYGMRCFPDVNNMKWASSYFLKVNSPIPVSLLRDKTAKPYYVPFGQSVIMDFTKGVELNRRYSTTVGKWRETLWLKALEKVPAEFLLQFVGLINGNTLSKECIDWMAKNSSVMEYFMGNNSTRSR